MESDGIEVYVAYDIIQGDEVPFYILWQSDDVTQIEIGLDGFERIVEYYNLKEGFPVNNMSINVTDLKTPKYIGGVLKVPITTSPYRDARFNVSFRQSNGEGTEVTVERILYNTKIDIIAIPSKINVPSIARPITIGLKGATTVFIDIRSTEDSSLCIELPDDAKTAVEKTARSIIDGFGKLKEKYPQEYQKIEQISQSIPALQNASSIERLYERVQETVNPFNMDKEFYSELVRIYEDAFLRDVDFLSAVLVPIIKYVQANIASKSYLINPLLCVRVPKGGGNLKAVISFVNVIGGIDSLNLETSIDSQSDTSIPIRDLITIERAE